MKRFLWFLLIIACIFGCNRSAQDAGSSSSIDYQQAKQFSDEFAIDFLHKNKQKMIAKLDPSVTQNMSQSQIDSVFDTMLSMAGTPIEITYKSSEEGYKINVGGKKPLRKFWYAVKTTKYPKGYYLFVEVVPNGKSLASTGFFLAKFPMGAPPELQ
jgi:hypothetical protein